MNTNFIPAPPDQSQRLEAAATRTATYAGTTLDLGAKFAPGGHGQRFSAVANISAIDRVTGDETYGFKVQQSIDGVTWTDVSVTVNETTTGTVSIPAWLSQRYVRLNLAIAGTTPSITYEAWLVAHPVTQ